MTQTMAEAVQGRHLRFDTALMMEATKDQSLYFMEANTPLIFLRYLPNENDDLPTPFLPPALGLDVKDT